MDTPERTGMRGFEARERDGKKRTGRGSSIEKRGVLLRFTQGRKWVGRLNLSRVSPWQHWWSPMTLTLSSDGSFPTTLTLHCTNSYLFFAAKYCHGEQSALCQY
jgi:hypothetical protein